MHQITLCRSSTQCFFYLLRSFFNNNNFSHKSTKFMVIFFCLFGCLFVYVCVYVGVFAKITMKIAVHTKQNDCIKRNIRFYRKIRIAMTTIECYNHTLWTDCCRIQTTKRCGNMAMESIFQKKNAENGVWCWQRRYKLKLNSLKVCSFHFTLWWYIRFLLFKKTAITFSFMSVLNR